MAERHVSEFNGPFGTCLAGQLQACRCLCHIYCMLCPDAAQSIIYNERQLVLLRRMGHRSHEADVLETISELYMGLGTDR